MKDLHLEFKRNTGLMPIIEVDIDENDDLLPNHYIVERTDLNDFALFNSWDNTLTGHRLEYVEFLENKIEELKKKVSSKQ